MPGTADERGLADPFDPEQAIPEAARFLGELDRKFGNIGLAVAAYNAGPGRVAKWLNGARTLPRETRYFVLAVTGRSADEWSRSAGYLRSSAEPQSCAEVRTVLQQRVRLNDAGTDRLSLLPGIEPSNGALPKMTRSGSMLPGTEQSGQMLPSMR
jgi:hypothetical protein